jgi:hypothetical protein
VRSGNPANYQNAAFVGCSFFLRIFKAPSHCCKRILCYQALTNFL